MPDILVGGPVGHPYGPAQGVRAEATGSVRYFRQHALAVGGVAAGPGSIRVPVSGGEAEWVALDPGEWTAEVRLGGPGPTGTMWHIPLTLTEGMTRETLADHVVVKMGGREWAKGDPAPPPVVTWDGTTIVVDGERGPDLQGPQGEGADVDWDSLDGRPEAFPAEPHTHTGDQVTATAVGEVANLDTWVELLYSVTTTAVSLALAAQAEVASSFSRDVTSLAAPAPQSGTISFHRGGYSLLILQFTDVVWTEAVEGAVALMTLDDRSRPATPAQVFLDGMGVRIEAASGATQVTATGIPANTPVSGQVVWRTALSYPSDTLPGTLL